jgi:hypothetical protein
VKGRRVGRRVVRWWSGGGEGPRKADKLGRKAEATNQFQPPRCGLYVVKLCASGPSSASSSCQTMPAGVWPNTEGGQTADGRWNPPTNFRHLVGDLLGMGNLRRNWHPATRRRPDAVQDRGPHRKIARRTARPISEGGTATAGRWNGDCRKVERRLSEGGTHRKISGTSLEIYWI